MKAPRQIGIRLRETLDAHELRVQFIDDLSDNELILLVTDVFERLSLGIPISPPPEFERWARAMLKSDQFPEMEELIAVLTAEHSIVEPLAPRAQESLAIGLLWETLLIEECQRRLGGLGSPPTLHIV